MAEAPKKIDPELANLRKQITHKRAHLNNEGKYDVNVALELAMEYREGLIKIGYSEKDAQEASRQLYQIFLERDLKIPAAETQSRLQAFDTPAQANSEEKGTAATTNTNPQEDSSIGKAMKAYCRVYNAEFQEYKKEHNIQDEQVAMASFYAEEHNKPEFAKKTAPADALVYLQENSSVGKTIKAFCQVYTADFQKYKKEHNIQDEQLAMASFYAEEFNKPEFAKKVAPAHALVDSQNQEEPKIDIRELRRKFFDDAHKLTSASTFNAQATLDVMAEYDTLYKAGFAVNGTPDEYNASLVKGLSASFPMYSVEQIEAKLKAQQEKNARATINNLNIAGVNITEQQATEDAAQPQQRPNTQQSNTAQSQQTSAAEQTNTAENAEVTKNVIEATLETNASATETASAETETTEAKTIGEMFPELAKSPGPTYNSDFDDEIYCALFSARFKAFKDNLLKDKKYAKFVARMLPIVGEEEFKKALKDPIKSRKLFLHYEHSYEPDLRRDYIVNDVKETLNCTVEEAIIIAAQNSFHVDEANEIFEAAGMPTVRNQAEIDSLAAKAIKSAEERGGLNPSSTETYTLGELQPYFKTFDKEDMNDEDFVEDYDLYLFCTIFHKEFADFAKKFLSDPEYKYSREIFDLGLRELSLLKNPPRSLFGMSKSVMELFLTNSSVDYETHQIKVKIVQEIRSSFNEEFAPHGESESETHTPQGSYSTCTAQDAVIIAAKKLNLTPEQANKVFVELGIEPVESPEELESLATEAQEKAKAKGIAEETEREAKVARRAAEEANSDTEEIAEKIKEEEDKWMSLHNEEYAAEEAENSEVAEAEETAAEDESGDFSEEDLSAEEMEALTLGNMFPELAGTEDTSGINDFDPDLYGAVFRGRFNTFREKAFSGDPAYAEFATTYKGYEAKLRDPDSSDAIEMFRDFEGNFATDKENFELRNKVIEEISRNFNNRGTYQENGVPKFYENTYAGCTVKEAVQRAVQHLVEANEITPEEAKKVLFDAGITLAEEVAEEVTAETAAEVAEAEKIDETEAAAAAGRPTEAFIFDDAYRSGRAGETFLDTADGGVSKTYKIKSGTLPGGIEISEGTTQTCTVNAGEDVNDLLKVTRTVSLDGASHEEDYLIFKDGDAGKVEMIVTEKFLAEMRSSNPNFLSGVAAGTKIPVETVTLTQNRIGVSLKVGSETVSLDISAFYENGKDHAGVVAQRINSNDDGTVDINNLLITPNFLRRATRATEESRFGCELSHEEPSYSSHLVQFLTYERRRNNREHPDQASTMIVEEVEENDQAKLYSVPVQPLRGEGISYLNLMNLEGQNYAYLHLQNKENNARTQTTPQKYKINNMFFEEIPSDGGGDGAPGSASVSLTLQIGKSSAEYVSIKMSKLQAIDFLYNLKEHPSLVESLPEETKTKLINAAKALPAERSGEPTVSEISILSSIVGPHTKRDDQHYVRAYDDVANITNVTELEPENTEEIAEEEAEEEHIVATDPAPVTPDGETTDETTDETEETDEIERPEPEPRPGIGEEIERDYGFNDPAGPAHMVKRDNEPEINLPNAVENSMLALGAIMLLLGIFCPPLLTLGTALLGGGVFVAAGGHNIPIRIRNARNEERNKYIDSIDPAENEKRIEASRENIRYCQDQIARLEADGSMNPKKKQKQIKYFENLVEQENIKIAQAETRSQIFYNAGRCQNNEEYSNLINQTVKAADGLKAKYNTDFSKVQEEQDKFLSACVKYQILPQEDPSTNIDAVTYRRLTQKYKTGEATEDDIAQIQAIQAAVVTNSTRISGDSDEIDRIVTENSGLGKSRADVEAEFAEFRGRAETQTVDASGNPTGRNAALVTTESLLVDTRNQYVEERDKNHSLLNRLVYERAALYGLTRATVRPSVQAINSATGAALNVAEAAETRSRGVLDPATETFDGEGSTAETAAYLGEEVQKEQWKIERRTVAAEEADRSLQVYNLENLTPERVVTEAENAANRGEHYNTATAAQNAKQESQRLRGMENTR